MKRLLVAIVTLVLCGGLAQASGPTTPITSLPDQPIATLAGFEEVSIASFDPNGVPNFLAGRLGRLGPGVPEAAALRFIQRLAPLFRATGREELAPVRTEYDDLGQVHVRFQQYFNGLPVVGAEMVVHATVADGRVVAINGRFTPDSGLARQPALDADRAVRDAIEELGLADAELAARPELLYVVDDNAKAYLAWSFYIDYLDANGEQVDRVFVDAVNGGVVTSWAMIKRALNRKIYNGNHTNPDNPTLPGTLMFSEGGSSTDASAMDCYNNFGYTYNFYKSQFNRDSFDNAGATLIGTVHVGTNWVNAYWDGTQMVFGDGDGTNASYLSHALDVVAHELTHAVTDRTANLNYEKESGALNEAMSDILGASVEAYRDGGANANTWKIGEEVWTPSVSGDALRYMNNPTQDGSSPDYYPERDYSGTCTPSSSNDYCGVHTNSGIANLAYYLLSQGGTHPRNKTSVSVTGIGIAKAEQIFYRALTQIMTSTTNFQGARNATAQAATDLYGAGSTELASVQACWDAVGAPGGGGGGGVTVLTNGQTVTNLSGSTGGWQYFKITVPTSQTSLQITMSGGSGDGDLYVKFGAQPTSSSYDYRPYLSGNNESASVTNPAAGDWYIGIYAYSTYSGVSLNATYSGSGGGGGGVTVLTNGQTVSNLSGASASWAYYKITVPSGQSSLAIQTSGGSGDCDLYVKLGAQPTSSSYDYRPYKSGNAESVSVTNPAAGDWYIGLYAYAAYSGMSLQATYTGSTQNPEFTLAASPTSVTIAQNATGTVTVSTTVSGGFNSAISLSVSGTPSGASVSFSPTSIAAPGSGSATMTIAAGTATAGTYSLTVTGAGGGKTHTATVSLTVTGGGSGTMNESESNNTTSTADVISASGTKVTGYVGTSTDVDYFKLTLPGSKTLTVDLAVPSSKDYDVKVYNSSGTVLVSGTNGSGVAEHVTYTNTSTSSRVIYIKVYGYASAYSSTLPYLLTVSW